MTAARLEHVNFTVADSKRTAERLVDLFGWHIRWEGEAIHGGYSVHVGTEDDYLAIYSVGSARDGTAPRHQQLAGLNHIGVVVDDLDAVEARVTGAGYEITQKADYDPGRRFYFFNEDGVEFEVVSYA